MMKTPSDLLPLEKKMFCCEAGDSYRINNTWTTEFKFKNIRFRSSIVSSSIEFEPLNLVSSYYAIRKMVLGVGADIMFYKCEPGYQDIYYMIIRSPADKIELICLALYNHEAMVRPSFIERYEQHEALLAKQKQEKEEYTKGLKKMYFCEEQT